jgi:hypothetical protein
MATQSNLNTELNSLINDPFQIGPEYIPGFEPSIGKKEEGPEMMPRTEAELDIEIAEEEVSAAEQEVAGTPPGSDENKKAQTRLVRSKSKLSKASEVGAIQRQTYTMDPVERAKSNVKLAKNTAWVGQARYSDNEPPQIIRTPDGQMWYKQGPYVSPIKDMNEAEQLVSLDTQMAGVQEKRKKNRVEEMELRESLETSRLERSYYEGVNRKLISDRLANHSSRDDVDLEALSIIYDNQPLLSSILAMNPEDAMRTLSQLEEMIFAGGSPSAMEAVVDQGSKSSSSRRANTRSRALGVIDNKIESVNREIKLEREALENGQAMLAFDYLDESGQPLTPEKRAVVQEAVSKSRAELEELKDRRRRSHGMRSQVSEEHGAEHQSGERSIDRIWAGDESEWREMSRPGGQMFCVLSLAARNFKNGHDGVGGSDHGSLQQLLAPGNTRNLAEFIDECQNVARDMGWDVSDDNVEMWMELISRHITDVADPAVIDSVVRARETEPAMPGGVGAMTLGELSGMPGGMPGGDAAPPPEAMLIEAAPEFSLRFTESRGERPEPGSEEITAWSGDLLVELMGSGISEQDARDISDLVLVGLSIEEAIASQFGPNR